MQFNGIDLGACGRTDIQFLHQAGIRWDELVNGILREEATAQANDLAQKYGAMDQEKNEWAEQAYQRARQKNPRPPIPPKQG